MININDVEILDLLPYTFKIPKYKALSRTMKVLKGVFYNMISAAVIWADIENAAPVVLDAMAAELDAPFYSVDMTVEQKRSIIAAAFVYNSQVGTLSSVSGLLSAAFGNGDVTEWFDYGGDPYHFKVQMDGDKAHTDKSDFEYFYKMLDKIKNLRAKLDALSISYPPVTSTAYYAGAACMKKYESIPQHQYNTYETLKRYSFSAAATKTYGQLMLKED